MWFSALIMMATFLGKLGLVKWFSQNIEFAIGHAGVSWSGGLQTYKITY